MTTEFFVKPSVPVAARSIALSPIDQLHAPVRQFEVFCFKLSARHAKHTIQDSLFKGLSHTLAEFPEYLSKVVDEEGDKGYKRLDISEDASVRLLCKDYEDSELQESWTAGSYEQLEKENMPSSKLTTALLAQHAADPDPFALGVQANFIPGGLLLSILWHHGVYDGTGVNSLLTSWSNYTARIINGESITPPSRILSSSLDRRALSHGTATADINQVPALQWSKDAALPDFSKGLPHCTLTFWSVTPEKAARLKQVATSQDGQDSWVSTGDAYSALLWKQYAAARAASANEPMASGLWFPVDVRQRMQPPLPSTYLGNAIYPCMIPSDSAQLEKEPLHATASAVRSAIASADESKVRTEIGFLSSLPKMTDISFRINLFGADLALTNWSGQNYLNSQWGAAMGVPQYLRRTGDSALFGGVACFQPKDVKGNMTVMTMFEVETTELLKKDKIFREYFDFVCH